MASIKPNLKIKKITEANRLAWNEATTIHQKARKLLKNDLKKKFSRKGFSTLDKIETAKLKKIGLVGKKVAQICCNNGRETLSLMALGADSAIGFDISDRAIKEARGLSRISGLNCRFVRTDVYDIGRKYYNSFDLIYITIGALAWLPDLRKFFKIIYKMLTPGGYLMIYEHHPFGCMLATDGEKEYDPDDPLKIVHSYFRKEPWISNDGIDYIGMTRYKAKTAYDYSQTLSYIINSISGSGIVIKEFNEYHHDISTRCARHERANKIPLSYILIGQK